LNLFDPAFHDEAVHGDVVHRLVPRENVTVCNRLQGNTIEIDDDEPMDGGKWKMRNVEIAFLHRVAIGIDTVDYWVECYNAKAKCISDFEIGPNPLVVTV
jgi:hypothetical protein